MPSDQDDLPPTKWPALLTETLRIALKDCDGYPTYFWKPKAMTKLAALGLVEAVPERNRGGQAAYRITDAGKGVLNAR